MSNCVVMSMDSRIANNDKTILSLQLEELEPVFMVRMATINLSMHLDCNAVGNLHSGDVHQDSGDGIHSPRELLPQEHVEHHGFCCCGIGVGSL